MKNTKYGKILSNLETQKTLIEKLKDQYNEQSWEVFHSAYAPYLYIVIHNMNMRHHDCEDLLQEILLKAWKSLPNFNYQPDKHRFRSWLLTITRNSVLNFKKNKSRQMMESATNENADLETYLNSIALPDIESDIQEEWDHYIANLAFEAINEKFQPHIIEAFQLLLSGKTPQVVSEELNIETATLYVYKKRVQSALYKEVLRLEHELG